MAARSISSEQKRNRLPDIRLDMSIIIVGAGVFGLSTALHLLQNGLTDVTILDAQNLDTKRYLPFNGADSASSDTRKVIRAAHGSAGRPSDLAIHGSHRRLESVEQGSPINCSWTRLNERGETLPIEVDTLATMEKLVLRDSHYRLDDVAEGESAVAQGWAKSKIDPFNCAIRKLPLEGVLDSMAGFVRAADACSFAVERVKRLDGKTVFRSAGDVVELLYESEQVGQNGKKVVDVKTKDGRDHLSDVVIVASWSQDALPSPKFKRYV